jgi:D-alanine-D-alanine ligase
MIRVAVVFGGRSTEHDVSCRSAVSVISHLDPGRYEVLPVRITREGEWIAGAPGPVRADLDVDALRGMTAGPAPTAGLASAMAAIGGADVVFPVLHGVFGEDGTVQGMLELLGVPYVGSGVTASAVSIDKELTKTVLRAGGLPVAGGVVLRDPAEVVGEADRERLGLPVFVKPCSGGSSIGVTRVDDWEKLDAAVAEAFRTDRKVLVEPAVPGREIDIPVLQFPDGRVVAGPALEIRPSAAHDFFSYTAKYEDKETIFDIPARIDERTSARLAEAAVRAFRALGCAGLLRVDFFVDTSVDGPPEIVLNEVNTMPGLTSVSQFPAAWRTAGTDYTALLTVLVDTALARRP